MSKKSKFKGNCKIAIEKGKLKSGFKSNLNIEMLKEFENRN